MTRFIPEDMDRYLSMIDCEIKQSASKPAVKRCNQPDNARFRCTRHHKPLPSALDGKSRCISQLGSQRRIVGEAVHLADMS